MWHKDFYLPAGIFMLGANKSAVISVQRFICDKKHQLRFVLFILYLLLFVNPKTYLVDL